MSTFYYAGHQQHQTANQQAIPQSHNHHGRSRRAPRLSAAQNSHRQFRAQKVVKEIVIAEPPSMTAYRARFEAGRSFDLDDDLEFCPNLLTEVDMVSIHSSSSDRSSLSSGSPES